VVSFFHVFKLKFFVHLLSQGLPDSKESVFLKYSEEPADLKVKKKFINCNNQ